MKKHIAGIVPVSGLRADFNMPWHESLMPISPGYLAIERAVAECAYAGCSTIWIVCNDDVTPLVRYQVGEKIQDPVYAYRHFEHCKNDVKRPIRIYYTPLAIRDINKRDNLAWSAIFGAKTAHNISKRISKWLTPDKFYISWPYGYYDPSCVREHRKTILETDFIFTHDSKTIKDNLYLGATLRIDQINQLMGEVRQKSTGMWKDREKKERLPITDRFSYRNFDLSTVFDSIDIKNYQHGEIRKYYPIDSWEKYKYFLSSEEEVNKPFFLNTSEWNEIGYDEEV